MFEFEMVIYFIFYAIIINIPDATAKVDRKSVNLELETSLLFDPKEGTNHTIADIKNFIVRLQSLLNPIKAMLEPNNIKMSDVIENIASRVNEYDDKDFEKLSRVVIKEVDERINNNKQLSVLLGDKYKTVIQYIHENPNLIRFHTRKSANNKSYKAIKFLISKLDKYYDENDAKKLSKIVRRLENVPKRNEDLRKIVKEALDVVVFDKYKNLNNTVKSRLFSELLAMQRYLKIKMSKEHSTLSKNEEFKYDDSSDLSEPQFSNEDIKHTNDTNGEIILNKNIEILIENDDLKL